MFESALFVVGFLSLIWVVCTPRMSVASVVVSTGRYNLGEHSPSGLSNAVRLWTGVVCQQSAWMKIAGILMCPTILVRVGRHNTKRVRRVLGCSHSEMDSTALFPRRHSKRGGVASDDGSGFPQRKSRFPGK